MNIDTSSIQGRFFNKMIYIVIIAASLWFLIWVVTQYLYCQSQANDLRVNYIESHKSILKIEVSNTIKHINHTVKSLEKISNYTKEELKKEVLHHIFYFRFGEDGYFFGSTFQGDSLFSNGKLTLGDNNIWDLTDPNGVKIIQEQRKAVNNPEGGFVSYSWPKIENKTPTQKISFVKAVPGLDWMIGAGIYLDTIDKEIADSKSVLYKRLIIQIIQSTIVTVFMLCLIYFWAKRIGDQMNQSIETLASSLKRASSESLPIAPEKIQFTEFQNIARLINEMLEAKQLTMDKLAKSKTDLDSIFKVSPSGIGVVHNNLLTMVSDRMCEISGYSKKELIGQNIKMLSPTDENYQFIADTRLRESINQRTITIETQLKNKEGKIVDILLGTTPFNSESSTKEFTFTALDISKQKKGEAERIQLEKQIHQSQKMESIGTLAGGIAHDFNNILFPIIGYTDMLIRDIEKENPYRKSVDQIQKSAYRARDLVRQILTFARQREGELMLIKMQPVVKEALQLIRSTIPTTIKIEQDIHSSCRPVKIDPTQIHQIVMNLTTNAYHAMEEHGGTMTIELKEVDLKKFDLNVIDLDPGTYVCLTISDTGKGMDKDLTTKIFDPFFTTKELGKGTGMGLAVVHGIVQAMKGTIQVKSELGKGTEFKIYVPLALSSSQQQLNIDKIKQPYKTGTEHILIVDDEISIVEMVVKFLKRLGYKVTSRTSSIEALEAFRAVPDRYDLVITDMAMPNMSGEKLSIEINKIRPGTPILLCSGFSENISEERAESLGIKGFILKPVAFSQMSQKIREILK